MNIKKIIPSRSIRVKIMQLFSFIPDVMMVKMQYWIKTGRILNLKFPRRFTEKLQVYKLFYRDPQMKICVDKYDVRSYIEKQGYGHILNNCLGIYSSPDDIDFDSLPNRFVIKDTLGGGGNAVIIVNDKDRFDVNKVKKQMYLWVNYPIDKKHPGREWVYDGKKHRIIIEEYIESEQSKGGLIDYKFFCNYGEPKFIYVIADRVIGKSGALGIYTSNFIKMPVVRADEKPLKRTIQKPQNFEEMKKIAAALSKPFPEARIDLYNVEGRIIFGEITFFDGSGYMTFTPDKYDYVLGDMFKFKNDSKWQKQY